MFRVRRAGALPSSSLSDSSVVAALSMALGGSAGVSAMAAAALNRPRAVASTSEWARVRAKRVSLRLLMGFLLWQNVRNGEAVAGEVGACGFLDIFGGHALQSGQFLIDQPPGQADGFQLTDSAGLTGDGVALVDQPGDDLSADPLKLFLGWWLVFQLVEQ